MNLKKIALTTAIMFNIAYGVIGQADIGPGARSIALGETGLGFRDINAVFTNPAGLTSIKRISVLTSASRPFVIRELSRVQIAGAVPLSTTDILFGSVSNKGSSAFRQTRVSLGYARKIADNLSLAVELETLLLTIKGYGQAFTLGYGISVQHQPFDRLLVGAHLRNPIPLLNDGGIVPKSIFSLGLSYIPSDVLSVNAEVFKDTQFKLRMKYGIEYRAHPVFVLRIGASTNPALLHFGFGWIVHDKMTIDFAVEYQTLLGVTPVIGVGYPCKKVLISQLR